MACPCNSNITIITPTVSCSNCLIAKTIRYGCDNAPDPCGEEVSIDLAEINNVDVCKDCAAVYTIKKFDEVGFSDVSITSDGVLTYTTSSVFEKHKEYEITYKVTCPCASPILSTTAKVYVCKKDLCRTSPTGSACNKCDGKYIWAKDHTILAADSDISKCTGTGEFNLSTIVEKSVGLVLTYSVYDHSSGIDNISLDANTGVIEFDKNGTTYDTQTITYAVSSGELYNEGVLSIQVANLCSGVHCSAGYTCNECTGLCVADSIDLQLN